MNAAVQKTHRAHDRSIARRGRGCWSRRAGPGVAGPVGAVGEVLEAVPLLQEYVFTSAMYDYGLRVGGQKTSAYATKISSSRV